MTPPTPPDLAAPFQPNWVSKPGNTITNLLEYRGMTVAELAVRVNLDIPTIEQVIVAQRPIDNVLANSLSSVFGMSVWFWINRQAQYDADFIRLGKGVLPYEPPFPNTQNPA